MEIDVIYSYDREPVCVHIIQPTIKLRDVLNAILQRKGDQMTMHNHGCQFFLVIDPKDYNGHYDDLIDDVIRILNEDRYSQHLGTAVKDTSEGGSPQGITIVITGMEGGKSNDLHRRYAANNNLQYLNRVCILEWYEYPDKEIKNQSADSHPFQWINFDYNKDHPIGTDNYSPPEHGQVNQLHGRGINIRVWNVEGGGLYMSSTNKTEDVILEGTDSANCYLDNISKVRDLLNHQIPLGQNISAHITKCNNNKKILLTWKGVSSNNIYYSEGQYDEGLWNFNRQLNLTNFLQERPRAIASTIVVTPSVSTDDRK